MATMTQVPTVSRDELKRMMDSGEQFILAETLPRHTFLQGHLPGAINLPPDEIRQLAPHRIPDKNARIFVYSESPTCGFSDQAAQDLMAMGYRNVRNYHDGKTDWVDSGLMLESGEERNAAG